MANVFYHLGPWLWHATPFPQWGPPPSCVGSVDLATPGQCAQQANQTARGMGFFATTAPLDSAYTPLGQGDCREIAVAAAMRSAWQAQTGYSPQGDRLVNLLWDQLTGGSDPDGQAFVKPLMPTAQSILELHLGGHSVIAQQRFAWGQHPHTMKIKQLLRAEFAELMDSAQKGRLRDKAGRVDREQHRKVLDSMCEKYRLNGADEWKELVPQKLQKDVPGRLKHETTITDNFTRADGTTIGNLLSWTEVVGDFQTMSNHVELNVYDGTYSFTRAESDLSSADHYAQFAFETTSGADVQMGPVCRFLASNTTGYLMLTRPSDSLYRKYKIVAGSFTQLGASDTLTIDSATYKTQANGSTVSIFKNGANQQDSTDSAITGNLRTGIMLRAPSITIGRIDDFEAADLAAAGGSGPLVGGSLLVGGALIRGRLVG